MTPQSEEFFFSTVKKVKTFTFTFFFQVQCSALHFHFFTCHKTEWKSGDVRGCVLGWNQWMMETDETLVNKDVQTLRHDVDLLMLTERGKKKIIQ